MVEKVLSFDTSQLTANWDNSNKETVHTKDEVIGWSEITSSVSIHPPTIRHGALPPSSSRIGTGERHRELTPTRLQSRSTASRHSSPGGPPPGGVRRTPSSSSGRKENSGV